MVISKFVIVITIIPPDSIRHDDDVDMIKQPPFQGHYTGQPALAGTSS